MKKTSSFNLNNIIQGNKLLKRNAHRKNRLFKKFLWIFNLIKETRQEIKIKGI